ncbi:hypothetical protein J1N35_044438 [Gossypium stocksii]|uniref:Uncharacterized protein n=1 Tax=Gossypium stocksii TaxID=47602 RepID=A0A9D3U9D8_9ROSI|nr:hypothetical protein J1N35_044438 [Gossypium stocksii]
MSRLIHMEVQGKIADRGILYQLWKVRWCEGHIDVLESMKVQLSDNVAEALSSNWITMRETLNTTMDDQTEKLTKNYALEAMFMALKEEIEAMMEKIEELEGELALCKTTVTKGMLASVFR